MVTRLFLKAAAMGHEGTAILANASASSVEGRLRETHHRIANNLALIAGFVRLQARRLAREGRDLSPVEGRRLLEEVGARVETVARFNRLLSNHTDQRVELGGFMAAACEALAESLALEAPIEIVCDAPRCEIDRDRAELIGMAVAELTANAVKYAHPAGAPGRIDVRCRRTAAGVLMVSVADDGVGLPENFQPSAHNGLGMRVVHSLARQLSADLEFDSHPLGLTVTLTVPPAKSSRSVHRAPIALASG